MMPVSTKRAQVHSQEQLEIWIPAQTMGNKDQCQNPQKILKTTNNSPKS